MKTDLALVVVLFLCFGCKSKKNSLNEDHLKGHVRQVTDRYYKPVEKFGELQPDPFTEKAVYEYNQSGNIEKYMLYQGDTTTPSFRGISHYDPAGRLISRDRKDAGITAHIRFEYNNDGNLVAESEYLQDAVLNIKHRYKYDKDGNVVEQSSYSGEGTLFEKASNTNNSDGAIAELKGDDFRQVYTYDQDGNQTQVEHYSKGSLIATERFEYDHVDGHGNWTKKVIVMNGKAKALIYRTLVYD